MAKQRIQVSLNPGLVKEALIILKDRKFDSLSEYLEHLVRQECEKRGNEHALVQDAELQGKN